MFVPPSGPPDARIMLVGEAPGEHEVHAMKPFVGPSGWELDRMLHDAGILRNECFCTNVVRVRPPNNDISKLFAKAKKDRTSLHTEYKGRWCTPEVLGGTRLLAKEIELVKPNVLIALGGTALWALTGLEGIGKWRGSMLYTDGVGGTPSGFKVIPTYHPAAILRIWKQRATTVQDMRRAARFRGGDPYPKPQWNFKIRPTYHEVITCLDQLYVRVNHREHLDLAFDLETRSGHIACAGIAWNRSDAICIPFMCQGKAEGYWDQECEAQIVYRLYRLLTHPNCRVIGQNLLYDCQYTYRDWGFIPRVYQDTMINQHALYSDLQKSLDFLASMYCDYYVYWKDEGKTWDEKTGEDQLWYYNCEDCVYTFEVAQALRDLTAKMGMEAVAAAQQEMFWPVLEAMKRGVRIDTDRKARMVMEVQQAISLRHKFFIDVLGHELNPDSPKQISTLFYNDLGLPVQMTRATKQAPPRPTVDDEALMKLARIEPCIKPLINAIADCRTLGKFLSNFLMRPLSVIDGRMRCSFNIGGSSSGKSAPKTYRLSSSEDAFGTGTNLQTIPSESSKSLGKAAARGGIAALGDPYSFPNIREIFIPDPGYTWFDLDLERADLFVVVYEADDKDLKTAMKMGVDMHLLNAFTLINKEPPPYEELIEKHSETETCSCRGTCYWERRQRYKHERQFAKTFVHGTDYCGKPRTMSAHTGRTVAEVERAQRIWFGAHPGIERWHERVQREIATKRYVENKFGYKWRIFDRLDTVLPEAVAWVPQSTVSIVINRIWRRLHTDLTDVQVLLQLHDSIPGQFPTAKAKEVLPRIRELSAITVPYDDPLIIPVSIKTSQRSWGDC